MDGEDPMYGDEVPQALPQGSRRAVFQVDAGNAPHLDLIGRLVAFVSDGNVCSRRVGICNLRDSSY